MFVSPPPASGRLAVHARHPARQRRHLRWQRENDTWVASNTQPAHAPEQVEAEVNYIRDNGQRPVATPIRPRRDAQRAVAADPVIRNPRLLAQPASLEREGFQLVREASAVGDFEDEAQVRERYYPESIVLLRRLTGAAEAVIFDHTLRVDQAGREERGLREPVRYAPTTCARRRAGSATTCRRNAPNGAWPDASRSSTCGVRSATRAARAAGVAGRPQPGVRRPGGQ